MMRLYRVHYEDGNQKLFECSSKKALKEHLIAHINETGPVTKIVFIRIVKKEA